MWCRLLFRIIRAACIGVILALVILTFLISPARISGKSMLPTFSDGSIVLLYKIPHILGVYPSYGDIVAIDSRTERSRSIIDDFSEPLKNGYANIWGGASSRDIWVKRVIGLPRDILEIKEGQLYRNGENIKELYIFETMNSKSSWHYNVPEGTVFVMGDNRNVSVDSREIGSVPINHVLGKVLF